MKKRLLTLFAMCLCLASNTWAEDVTISSASELKAFATRVNGGETSLNAKLTSDITYTGDSYVQIGGNYFGTFDGQGHTVTVAIESTKQGAALFFNNRGTVQNLRVAGTITTSSNNPGGICFYNYGTIRNCASEVDFTFTGAGVSVTAGGISGQATNGSTIENCMFNGSFTKGEGANENTKHVGGLVGWMDGSPSVRNCLVIAGSDLGGDFKPVGRGYNTATSTYYMQKAGSTTSIQTSTGATAVTAEQLASGEIAYKLNGNVSGGTIWMQAIGTDANPSPIGSSIVYAIGSEGNRCDYTPLGSITSYTNSQPSVSSHLFEDGICSNCGTFDESYVTLSDGYYQIGTEKQLIWFAKKAEASATVNGKLTADIALSSAWTTPIGTQSVPFKGTFDGQNHAITGFNLTYDGGRQGLFGQTNGATIKNFSIDGTITANGNGGSDAGLGVIAWAEASTIQNVHSSLTVDATGTGLGSTHVGGVVGSLRKSGSGSTIDRCSFAGKMNGGSNKIDCFGCVVGYLHDDCVISNCANYGTLTITNIDGSSGGILAYSWMSGTAKIENCLNAGSINCNKTTNGGGAIIGWLRSYDSKKLSNNYWFSGTGSQAYGGQTDGSNTATEVTAEQLASGEVAYLLNGEISGGETWFQTLGTDDNPYPYGTDKVYKNGTFCPGGGAVGGFAYSNTNAAVEVSHNYTEGICDYCGNPDEAYLTVNAEGYYEIATPAELKWFATMVNKGSYTIKGKLTANIDYTTAYVQIGPKINNGEGFRGTFDGQGHTVTVAIVSSEQGAALFYNNYGTVENLRVAGTVESSSNNPGSISYYNYGTIRNCAAEVDFTLSYNGSVTAGGISGQAGSTASFENCLFKGSFKKAGTGTPTNVSGISGWDNGSTNVNCLVIASSDLGGQFAAIGRGGPKATICYYVAECNIDNSATAATDAQLTSGEIACKLGSAWHQVLGTDNIPTPLDSSKPSVYEIAVGEAGYASFVPTVNVATIPAGVTVYAGQDKGSYLHLEEVTEVPADNAVIVKAAEGSYYFNNTAEARTLGQTNDLKFSATDKTADGKQYCLAKKADVVGFYKVAEGQTIPARKVYLEAETGVKSFFGFDPGDATGLNEVLSVKNEESSAEIFNVAGQRISKMQRGINIVGGKKILK